MQQKLCILLFAAHVLTQQLTVRKCKLWIKQLILVSYKQWQLYTIRETEHIKGYKQWQLYIIRETERIKGYKQWQLYIIRETKRIKGYKQWQLYIIRETEHIKGYKQHMKQYKLCGMWYMRRCCINKLVLYNSNVLFSDYNNIKITISVHWLL